MWLLLPTFYVRLCLSFSLLLVHEQMSYQHIKQFVENTLMKNFKTGFTYLLKHSIIQLSDKMNLSPLYQKSEHKPNCVQAVISSWNSEVASYLTHHCSILKIYMFISLWLNSYNKLVSSIIKFQVFENLHRSFNIIEQTVILVHKYVRHCDNGP